MAVPKKRTSPARRGKRRAHDFLVATAATESCPSCAATKQRHHVCPSCGEYRGKKVFVDVDEAPVAE